SKIDSLDALLKQNKQAATAKAKAEYEVLLQQLSMAEKNMNDWMDEFDPDPKFSTSDSLTAYFKAQKTSAERMKVAVFAAIDSAKAKVLQ
ncbi:MAG: hypothetical protein EAY75_13050, partial [Bacteroidetes bacterium]